MNESASGFVRKSNSFSKDFHHSERYAKNNEYNTCSLLAKVSAAKNKLRSFSYVASTDSTCKTQNLGISAHTWSLGSILG